MQKLLLSTLLVSALSLTSQFAAASDGTITFNGQVVANTCTVNGNGTGMKDFTVTLPAVPASALAAAGHTAGRTPFNIALTGCTPTTGNVHTYFEAGPTTDASTGNLNVAGGGATNVQIQLLNGNDSSAIKAGFADGSQNSHSVALTAGAATLPYFAQYYATGAAGPGAANSSVMYTMTYN